VHAGGQAVVGMVETPGGGDRAKSENQPHALANAPGATMPSADTSREPVPVACDEERAMPDGRRNVPGAPKGNKNALKHGRYTAEAIGRRRSIAALVAIARRLA
jgi:hypothetical protein